MAARMRAPAIGPTGATASSPVPPSENGELAVGARIRQLREAEGLSMRKLATKSGLSVGFLSQVERGLSSIALSSLHQVTSALGCSMSEFFGEAQPAPAEDSTIFTLMRASEHPRRIVSTGRHYEMLSARVPGLILEPMLVYIEPGGPEDEPMAHDGEEFAYVLSGELLYEVAGVEHRLGPGDSLYLRSNTPHRFYNDGDVTTVVISVVTPRHY